MATCICITSDIPNTNISKSINHCSCLPCCKDNLHLSSTRCKMHFDAMPQALWLEATLDSLVTNSSNTPAKGGNQNHFDTLLFIAWLKNVLQHLWLSLFLFFINSQLIRLTYNLFTIIYKTITIDYDLLYFHFHFYGANCKPLWTEQCMMRNTWTI